MDTTTVIIGAGHAGRTERWNSLRLLTLNWQTQLPGRHYSGDDLGGFRTMPQLVAFIDDYAAVIKAPVRTRTTVTRVTATGTGFDVTTDDGVWNCASVGLE